MSFAARGLFFFVWVSTIALVNSKKSHGRLIQDDNGHWRMQGGQSPDENKTHPENAPLQYNSHHQERELVSKELVPLDTADVKDKLLCNACLVSVGEIITSLASEFKRAEEAGARALKKAEAVHAVKRTCQEELGKYGLITDPYVTTLFGAKVSEAITERYGLSTIFDPAVSEVLNSTCRQIADEYWGDFIVLMSSEYQTIEIQSKLCGPDPGIDQCKVHQLEFVKRERELKVKVQQAQRNAAQPDEPKDDFELDEELLRELGMDHDEL
eukprot:CAMPEP_0118945270 /NCGR_PEP_ID=MMETSP1169-20130426/41925_1 /TAXON_ID=36882 /ORGANISM="Pyramimonas obovata, Strain CCMP722" /LENGTH=268 /DNA_ID=CAMNT_0006890947 /DNA_START=105 /DNA_END=911 /DNA_ORIENTATION=-